MNIDELIKKELTEEASELDSIVAKEKGLFNMIAVSYQGGLKVWIILVNIFVMIASGFMLWTGYEFFVSVDVENRVFWGFCLMMAIHAQVGLKQWLFNEMNRSSLMREIKRLELSIEHLKNKV